MYMTPPSPMTVYPDHQGQMPLALGDFIQEETEDEAEEGQGSS